MEIKGRRAGRSGAKEKKREIKREKTQWLKARKMEMRRRILFSRL